MSLGVDCMHVQSHTVTGWALAIKYGAFNKMKDTIIACVLYGLHFLLPPIQQKGKSIFMLELNGQQKSLILL